MKDYLTLVLSAHFAAAGHRSMESAYAFGELLRAGNHNAALHRSRKVKALALGLIEHDRVLTGRV